MKLLVVSEARELKGGSTHSLLETLRALQKKGVTLEVVVPGTGSMKQAVEQLGLAVHILPFRQWIGPRPKEMGLLAFLRFWLGNCFRLFQNKRQFQELIKSTQPDFVLSNTIIAPAAAFAAKAEGIKHLWYIREYGDLDHGFYFLFGKAWTYRKILSLSHACLAISENIKTHYAPYGNAEKLKVIENAVEVDVPASSNFKTEATYKLGILGRVSESKGQPLALEALAHLYRQDEPHPLELHIIGSGMDLKPKIQDLELEGKVVLHGHVAEPWELVKEMDALLVPSRMEAFGRIIVEAMKLGVPVIASDTGAFPELLAEGRGLFFRYPDYQHLAYQILAFYDAFELHTKKAKENIAWSRERFNLEAHGKRLIDILKSKNNE